MTQDKATRQTGFIDSQMMEFHRILLAGGSLLHLCLAVSMQVAAGAHEGPPHPSCRKCGDVDIPYPFGIVSDDPQCGPIHLDFQLSCKAEDGALKLFAWNETIEVTNISVPHGKTRMKSWISSQCYDPATAQVLPTEAWMNLTGTSFSFSASDNTIIVVGCNTLGYMIGDTYVIGCSSTCGNMSDVKNGSCSGAGCCEADLPKDKGIQYYNGYFNQDYNTSKIWRSSPCSYMALMEKAAFNFSTAYTTSTTFNDTYTGKTPVVLDWVITYDTCEEAKNNKTIPYACVSSNSDCSYFNYGYRCNCSPGYEGNPYIVDGCTDINECLDNITYPCPGICRNTMGSYDCLCHQGQHKIGSSVCIPDQKSSPWVMPVVGASVGLVVLVVTATCAYLIKEKRKLRHIKQKYYRQHGGRELFQEMKNKQVISFTIFSEAELHEATNKFDDTHVLGHGGHGTVYKGLLKSDVEVAVKRCTTIDEQNKKEFGKEMLILSQINHRNIVKLLGCCLEVEIPMLVYEYIPKGTLFELIHGNHGLHISLGIRLRIAHESAEALAYLHSWASPPILHGDVKSSNILLDGAYTAKVSDFGASILAPTDKSQFVTVVQGTCGYLDPEYMQTYQLTDKSDVYSFGVVLLELLTGKKAFNLEGPEHERSLSMRFLSAMKENRVEEILDDQIKDDENMEFLEEIAELAKRCLEMCGENRPSMKEVAEKLDRLRRVMQHPWAQQNPEEMESLLGESSSMVSPVVVTTGNFSIEKKAIKGLESGR